MYEAIIYNIEGPRSHVKAIEEFNKLDHSGKIFNKINGVGSYIKSVIGRDFSFRSMSDKFGYRPGEQHLETYSGGIKIHIQVTNKGVGNPFNAVLIVNKDTETGLITPVYFIALDEQLIPTKPTWVNISVGYNKLVRDKKEDLKDN